MRLSKLLSYIFLIVFTQVVIADPVVQRVCNDTDFGFYILYHGDSSECSLHNKSIIIHPKTIFSHEFLLEIGHKGLVLRPVFYKNPKTGHIYWFVDQETYEYNPELIKKTYEVWKNQNDLRKYRENFQAWFDYWVGKDVSVTFDPLEVFGYLLNLSRIRIKNSRHDHVQWLSFAKGIFSKLVLNLHLTMLTRKGIMAKIIVNHGQGGICSNGVIERI